MRHQVEVNRYDFIDALRGLAILPVILIHTTYIVQPGQPFLRLVAANGVYGVQLFYVVSALTLFLSIDQRKANESRPTLNFFIRRFFRIAPLFYLALIVYTLIYGTGPNYWTPDGVHWWQYLLSILFLNSWHPEAINAIIPIGWSIAVEMAFYWLIPFLHKMLKDVRSTLIFIVASLFLQKLLAVTLNPILRQVIPTYIVNSYFYFWLFAQLPVFGLGILAYQIARNPQSHRDPKLGVGLLVTSLFLFLAFLNVSSYMDLIHPHVFFGIGFLGLTLALFFHPIKILVNPIICWLGKVSYSLYLVHFILVVYIQKLIHVQLPFGKSTQFVLYYLAVVLISSAISAVTYRFIEKPGIRLGKQLIQKLESRTSRMTVEEPVS
ncbi:MAG TPA: acyltransferase [Anaerolineales bacterium]|nr:acyltransferase [Anaerolineales bacterium]